MKTLTKKGECAIIVKVRVKEFFGKKRLDEGRLLKNGSEVYFNAYLPPSFWFFL
ncbi:MAG: hypothetical protein IKZ28_00230 [Clostridia bacterium]|nr:hypothetical protein [Clostridia bacterium]